MSNKKPLSKALSLVLSGGALGASLVLALSSARAAAASAAAPDGGSSQNGVAAQLKAIRSVVTEITAAGSAEGGEHDSSGLMPTWWGNGGWGRWHYGWGNHGWGWPNGWHNWGNGWPNWGNGPPSGWNNWNNGWHNYWHNT
jgi:rSAM-associated Gly-rich repeat protein